MLAGIGFATRAAEPRPVLIIPSTGLAIFFSLLSVPGLAAGFGLLARKNWGRILAIVVSMLGLPNFPLGTFIGAYALWVLFQDSAQAYFGAPKAVGQ